MIIELSDLKTYLSITDSTQDDYLNILVDAVNQQIINYIGRNVKAQDYTEYNDGDGQRILLLDNYPVNSISSFQVNEGTIETPERDDIDANDYKLVPEEGKIFLTFYKTRGFQNYKIEYNAGYSTIPGDLKLAGLKIASMTYNKSDGVSRETVAGDSVDFIQQDPTIFQILNYYKDV